MQGKMLMDNSEMFWRTKNDGTRKNPAGEFTIKHTKQSARLLKITVYTVNKYQEIDCGSNTWSNGHLYLSTVAFQDVGEDDNRIILRFCSD